MYTLNKRISIFLCTLPMEIKYIKVYNILTRSSKEDLIKTNKEVVIMCMTAEKMNETMQEIQEWKKTKEQAEQIISALEKEVIDFLQENEEDCKTTNKKGVEILQYIGNMCKATYSPQERETVNKDEVKKLLSKEDYQKVSKISRYNVLRIS